MLTCVWLLTCLQWNKDLFPPILIFLGLKSWFAQGHFWSLDSCYLSDKWFEHYLAAALPVPGWTFRSSWHWGLACPKKHWLAGPSFGDNAILLTQIQSPHCLLVSVPRHPQFSWDRQRTHDQGLLVLIPAERLVWLPTSVWIWWTELDDCICLMFSYIRWTCAFHNLLLLEHHQYNLKIIEVVNYGLELQKIPCWKAPLEIMCTNLQPTARPQIWFSRGVSSQGIFLSQGDSTTFLGCLFQCLVLFKMNNLIS